MNKKELVVALADKCGTTQVQAEAFVNAFCDTVTSELRQGHAVVLPRFGQFVAKHRPARQVRIPGTDRMTMSKAKMSGQFKASSVLKDL